MLFGFNVESVNNKPQRNEIMKSISAFMQPSSEDEVKNLAKASARRVNKTKSVSTERVVIERADLLSSVEERLMNQIKMEYQKDPSVKDRILQSIGQLPANERQAIINLEKNVQSLLEFNSQHGTVEQR